MLKVKFGKIIPTINERTGVWIRLVFSGNSIVQGQVLLCDAEGVIELAQGNIASYESVAEGDKRSGADGMLVTYTRIEGVTIRKEPNIRQNGQAPPVQDTQDD